jgi:hypothetical protein
VFGDTPRRWIGTMDEKRDGTSYIGILALGWSLTGAEIAERERQARDVALTANIAYKDDNVTPPGTPLAAGESHIKLQSRYPRGLPPCEHRRRHTSSLGMARLRHPRSHHRQQHHCAWKNRHKAGARGARSRKSRLNTQHHAKLATVR